MTNDETERNSDEAAGSGEAWQPPTAPRVELPPAAPETARAARRSPLAWVALLVALTALAAVAYLAWDLRRRTVDFDAAAGDVAASLAQTHAGLENQAKVLEQLAREDDRIDEAGKARERSMDELGRRLQVAERRLDEAAGGTDAARRTLWRTEVEQYLRLAERAARLARDPQSALVALRIADNRLRTLDDPALAGVRESLTADIDALESLPRIDIEGVALRLGRIAARADELPLDNRHASDRPAAAGANDDAQGFWARGWAAVRGAFASLVSVRRSDERVRPLLAPDQAWFLRQNLRLELEIARLAALRTDQANYEQSLQNAREWLATWFDVSAPAAAHALETLDTLSRVQLEAELPDLSDTLEALQRAVAQPEYSE